MYAAFRRAYWPIEAVMGSKIPFKACNYMILGDDIVIGDDATAMEYRKILHSLDVPISETKTHVSTDTFEFAKRWFHKGMEVTPFPVHALVETKTKYHLVLEILRQAERRGTLFPEISKCKPRSVHELFRIHGARGRLGRSLTT